MSVTMQLPVDSFLIEIGKLHLQNSTLQQQLAGANRRIAELTAENLRLVRAQVTEAPTPQQVESDVNEAIAANATNQPA